MRAIDTLSVPEAGQRLRGLSPSASYAAARRGEIPTIQDGLRLRVPKTAFENLLLARRALGAEVPVRRYRRRPQDQKRIPLNLRVTPQIRKELEQVAANTGRSLSQQTEFLIELALRSPSSLTAPLS
jgi:hypothetical protein